MKKTTNPSKTNSLAKDTKGKTPTTTKEKTPKKEKVINQEAKVELVEFCVMATIPTMPYGNIMPKITVKAPTIEMAKAFVMPEIEALYNTYAEKPRDGTTIAWMNKANVTVTEKKVEPVMPAQSATPPASPTAAAKPDLTTAPSYVPHVEDDEKPAEKSAAFLKAEHAINQSMTVDATNIIEDQIKASVKLSAEEKPELFTLVLKKRKALTEAL